MSNLN